jgi:hypothetical protein
MGRATHSTDKKQKRTTHSNAAIAQALEQARGNVTEAARALGYDRTTLYKRMYADPELMDIKNAVKEQTKDAIEGVLISSALSGDLTAVIFFLKTQARDRGYIETKQLEMGGIENGAPIDIRARDYRDVLAPLAPADDDGSE